MQKFISEADRRRREELKARIVAIFYEAPFTQEAIADAVGASQPTVSRWFTHDAAHFPNLYELAQLPVEILEPICALLLAPHNRSVGRRVPVVGRLNGKLDDELLNVDVIQADIIRMKDKDWQRTLKHIRELREMGDKMEAEVVASHPEAKPAFLRKIAD